MKTLNFKFLMVFLGICFITDSFSQNTKQFTGLKLAYSTGQAFEVGVGYGVAHYNNGENFIPGLIVSPTISGEIYQYNGTTRIAPKMSIEAHYLLVGGRLSLVNYNLGNNINDTRVIPEVGFSLVGLMDIFYGRSIPVNTIQNEASGYMPENRITIAINLPLLRIK